MVFVVWWELGFKRVKLGPKSVNFTLAPPPFEILDQPLVLHIINQNEMTIYQNIQHDLYLFAHGVQVIDVVLIQKKMKRNRIGSTEPWLSACKMDILLFML